MLTVGNIGNVGHKRSRVIDDRGRNTTVDPRHKNLKDGSKKPRKKISSNSSSSSSGSSDSESDSSNRSSAQFGDKLQHSMK